MKKIAYIVPYFGRIPNNFDLWTMSCQNNPSVDFYYVSDTRIPFKLPENVKFIELSFQSLVKIVREKIPEVAISIPVPYRLCDFKPAFGLIFEDLIPIDDYDFWGYCDVDVIFGNIRHFLTRNVLDNYDKIGWLGHSTLLKNTPRMKYLFKGVLGGAHPYVKCFSSGSNENSFFDEIAFNKIAESAGVVTYKDTIFANISPMYWNFRLNNLYGKNTLTNSIRIFTLEDSNLYSHEVKNQVLVRSEFMYIHFLRRKMNRKQLTTNNLLIYPNVIENYTGPLTVSIVKKIGKNNIYKYWLDFVSRKWRTFTIRKALKYVLVRIQAKIKTKQI